MVINISNSKFGGFVVDEENMKYDDMIEVKKSRSGPRCAGFPVDSRIGNRDGPEQKMVNA